MLDRLIDFLLGILDLFKFWLVVNAFERAVILRFGVHVRTLGPGIHWFAPFRIEEAITDNVVPRTVNLQTQSLTTADGEQVVVSGIVTAQIVDIEKAVLEVEGVDHALVDSCYAAIADMVAASTWAEIHAEEFANELAKACRKQARRYGIEVQRVQLSDCAKCWAVRVMNTT